MAKPDNENDNPGASKQSAQDGESQSEVKRGVRMITANDAGWITPTAFVAPLRFVTVDPPRPIKTSSPPPVG